MKRIAPYLILIAALAVCCSSPALAQGEKTLKTKYAVIYYSRDKDLDDFIWRIGGQRLELPRERSLAVSRVDRIVERVEEILDMHPKSFNIKIYLAGALAGPHKTAFYEYRTKAIHVAVPLASDGVIAHEVAHAVIHQYFVTPPSSKIQEILTRYVDKYLWSDY